METIWHAILNFLDSYGRLTTALVLLAAAWRVIAWARGVVPLSIRAGRIKKNKIAIFAKSDHKTELENSLNSTKLFSKNDFAIISTTGSIGDAVGSNIFVVNWEDFGNKIDDILAKKTPTTGMVVYALPGEIDKPNMTKLQEYNFVTVTNFRSRLITDLLTMALAIRYAKKN